MLGKIVTKNIITIGFFYGIILLLFTLNYALCQSTPIFKPGTVRLTALQDVVLFKSNISAIIFDTSDCVNCRETYPSYRLVDDLIVDSLIVDGITLPVIEESQMDSVEILDSDLIDTLESINIYKIAKTFPSSIPGDTIGWDAMTEKSYIKKDLSKHYYIIFDNSTSVDTVIDKLQNIQNISNVGAMEIPQPQFDYLY